MTQYVGCNQARELLEGLIDGELSLADQLAAESHLRWCSTCALRLEDLRLIGASLRMGSSTSTRDDEHAVAAMNEGVLLRVRAEREQSFGFRVREMFTDMRLLWPALGATAAVAVCMGVAAGVLQAATVQSPESLAALIETLAEPGSERNPLRPVNVRDPLRDGSQGISIPRVKMNDDAVTLEGIPDEDAIYTVRTVVNRDGRISSYELILADGDRRAGRAQDLGSDRAVLDAIQQTRFEPAQTPLGRPVAVDMVWVIAKTTAVAPPVAAVNAAPAPIELPKPAIEPATPANRRSANYRRSTTA